MAARSTTTPPRAVVSPETDRPKQHAAIARVPAAPGAWRMHARDLAERPPTNDGGADALPPSTHDIELTEEQHNAAIAAENHLFGQDGDEVMCLTGPAGSGKSTITRTIIDSWAETGMIVPPGGWGPDGAPDGYKLALLAPTNRAARRAAEVTGRPEWQTLHRFLYQPEESITPRGEKLAACLVEVEAQRQRALLRGDHAGALEANDAAARMRVDLRHERRVRFNRRPMLDFDVSAAIVDEASMVGVDVGKHLPEMPILAVGDEHQLKPVLSGEPWWNSAGSLTRLSQVHRHGGSIRGFAERMRAGRLPEGLHDLDEGPGGALHIFSAHFRWEGAAFAHMADVILVHTHAARRWYIVEVRNALLPVDTARDPTPVPGDVVVVRENRPDLGIHNGDICRVSLVRGSALHGTLRLALQPIDGAGRPLGDLILGVDIDCASLLQHRAGQSLTAPPIPPKSPWGRDAHKLLIDFAHALTVHAAQGSEWPRVMVAMETLRMRDADDARRWRYTASTRARSKLIVVT